MSTTWFPLFHPKVEVVSIVLWASWTLELCETCLSCLVVDESGRLLLGSSWQLCTTVDPLILGEYNLVRVQRVDYDLRFG